VPGRFPAGGFVGAPAGIAEVRRRGGIDDDVVVGLLGGSMGGAIVAELLATGSVAARAAVLANPLLELRPMIDAVSPAFGGYSWTDAGDMAAARIDYVHRAGEVTQSGAAIRVISGMDDEPWAVASAEAFALATGADLQQVEGVEHALADEPGVEPAPQTHAARMYDELAVAWFRRQLLGDGAAG
jgi:pimeloyl-ACP methyl ester carboxylesterase